MTYAKFELVMKRSKVHESKFEYKMNSSKEAYKFAKKVMRLQENPQEVFSIVMLNAKGEVIGYSEISRGDLTGSIVHPREVFKPAIIQNAAGIIAFHNHPSGNPEPSMEDINITRRLTDAGKLLGIRFIDHIVVGFDGYSSLSSQGYIEG